MGGEKGGEFYIASGKFLRERELSMKFNIKAKLSNTKSKWFAANLSSQT